MNCENCKVKDKYAKLEKGWEYQDFIAEQFLKIGLLFLPYQSRKYQLTKGESVNGIEVKFDDKLKETHNIYIETESRSPYYTNKWTKSVVMDLNSNSWLYVIGDYQSCFIFAVNQLRAYADYPKFKKVETETSRGYLIPTSDPIINKLCIKKIHFKEERKNND